MDSSAVTIPSFDVIVIGAGPAGAEAAMAAARDGARTLCLAINLDSIGFHPASPVLVEDAQDARGAILEEMEIIGGRLPGLIHHQGATAGNSDENAFRVRLVVDRRELGLAYKEAVESEERVEVRQALVSSVEPVAAPDCKSRWRVTGNLGEKFMAASVVVAAGTFLKGTVEDGGVVLPGGRRGEIPANALALWLQNLGIEMAEVRVSCGLRLDSRSIDSGATGCNFVSDGSQLAEVLAGEIRPQGDLCKQLSRVRQETGQEKAWITRASYTARHLVLRAGQVSADLQSLKHPGLFFAGRAAGSHSFAEAAALGVVAGMNASAKALSRDPGVLPRRTKFVGVLCEAIASSKNRPVSLIGSGNVSLPKK